MKKRYFVSLIMAILLSLPVFADTRTIYLHTGGPLFWSKNNPVLYIYAWTDGKQYTNVKLEHLQNYLYSAQLDKQYTNLMFVKFDSNTTSFDLDKKQSQTKEFVLSDANDMFTVTCDLLADGMDDFTDGYWSKYDETMKDYIAYGTCGDNLTWKINEQGVLDISGSGSMKDYSFYYYTWSPWYGYYSHITSVVLPQNIPNIGSYAFSYSNITTITIPSTVTSIGTEALNCNSLTSITSNATVPPTITPEPIGKKTEHIGTNLDKSIPLYVPKGSVDAYKKADYWKDFTNIQAIGGGGGGDTPGGDPVVNTLLPEAIDLGLPSGIRWSGMNVGAKTETEYGSFYQWGCTTPVTREGWDSYCHGAKNALTKYCTDNAFGTVDNKTVLDNADDAAAQTWGEGWRMPTKEEAEELWNNCTRTWHITPDCEGYIFTGPNGNSIFLPSQGWFDESGVTHSVDKDGFYWTSNLYGKNNNGAYALLTRKNTGEDGVLYGVENRHFARGIRGVLPKRSCRVTNSANVTITEGESFTYAGKTVTPAAGQYTYSAILAGANGCDSVLIWNVTVNKASVTMYTLSVKSNDARLGFVSGGGSYKSGETISMLAVPTAKCRFVKWNDGVTSNPRTMIMTKDYTFTAIFAAVAGSAEEKIGEQQEYDEKKDAVNPWANTSKVIQNSHIYILRNGKMYTVQGQEVK